MIGFDNGILIAYRMCPPCELLVPKEELSYILSTVDAPTYFMRCSSTELWETADFLNIAFLNLSPMCYFLFDIGYFHGPFNLILVRDKFNVKVATTLSSFLDGIPIRCCCPSTNTCA
jgi:hypothetical protein